VSYQCPAENTFLIKKIQLLAFLLPWIQLFLNSTIGGGEEWTETYEFKVISNAESTLMGTIPLLLVDKHWECFQFLVIVNHH
jgi:hypothetical protein